MNPFGIKKEAVIDFLYGIIIGLVLVAIMSIAISLKEIVREIKEGNEETISFHNWAIDNLEPYDTP